MGWGQTQSVSLGATTLNSSALESQAMTLLP